MQRITPDPRRGTRFGKQKQRPPINDNPRVKLTLQVTPPDGSEPFVIERKATVSRVRIPREGDLVDRLQKLGELRQSGVLTEAEFAGAKARILAAT